MRTTPAAMTWELFARSRWGMLVTALGATAFPTLILGLLRTDGVVDPDDESMLLMHLVMMQMNLFAFGAALYIAPGRMSQLYSYPARTSELVAWRMLPSMAVMFVEVVVSTALINAMFDVDWPIWGPALFAAAAFAALQATVWLAEKSLWMFVPLVVVGAVLGFWGKARHGAMFSDPTHMWREVTPAEMIFLVFVVMIAYAVAIFAVARNRRGEPPFSLGIIDWIYRRLEPGPAVGAPFRSAADAQSWFEWHYKGWLMPGITGLGLMAGVIGWLFSSRDVEELVGWFFACGGLLSVAALVAGIGMGNVGGNGASFVMGQFLATRPLSTTEMARIILRMTAKSVLLAWLIWAVSFLVIFGILALLGELPTRDFPKRSLLWYIPATLLGPWIVAGVWTTIGLAGRTKLFFQLLCLPLVTYIGATLFAKFALSPTMQTLLARVVVAILGFAALAVTVWVFAAARRRLMIQSATVCGAVGAWAVVALVVFTQLPRNEFPSYLLLAGVLALGIFPLAAAPLALSWNRHR